MMGWTLAGLFAVSILLLLISIYKGLQASKAEQNRIDMAHISVMKEINEMQEQIRKMELDLDIITTESGLQLSSEKKRFMREILDLYKRNYSIESIAEKMQISVSEMEQLLAPYPRTKEERRKVANEN